MRSSSMKGRRSEEGRGDAQLLPAPALAAYPVLTSARTNWFQPCFTPHIHPPPSPFKPPAPHIPAKGSCSRCLRHWAE